MSKVKNNISNTKISRRFQRAPLKNKYLFDGEKLSANLTGNRREVNKYTWPDAQKQANVTGKIILRFDLRKIILSCRLNRDAVVTRNRKLHFDER